MELQLDTSVSLTVPVVVDRKLIARIAGFGYAKLLAPPEWGLRWVENRLNLLKILPHYVSIDKTTYGRFGVLPTTNRPGPSGSAATELVGTTQRLGP